MLHLSGVAHCLRDITSSLISSGKFRVIQLGAAIKHDDMRPVKVHDDVIIIPTEGFGTIEQLHAVCVQNHIDLILFQSDPRFYNWLLCRDNEVRRNIPMIWYNIWDNNYYPVFNNWIFNSVDYNIPISQLTDDLIRTIAPKANVTYMPHCVNTNIFKPLSAADRIDFRTKHLPFTKDKFFVFWNNRNGRRKNGGTLIVAFRRFLDKIGHDKAVLLMKTDPVDHVGFNLPEIISGFGLEGKVYINSEKFDEPTLASIYSSADCVMNIANAEGFSMSTVESKACGTPVICAWTGGMREQICNNIDNPTEFYGIPVFPGSSTIIGSPELPWILEDQVSEQGVVDALMEMYELGDEKRLEWGKEGREHVLRDFNWDNFNAFWPAMFEAIHNEHGSWPNKHHVKFRFENLNPDIKKYESTKEPIDLPPSYSINKEHWIKFKDSKWTK